MIEFPKILVCCPTAQAKNYCFESWIENVMNFTYPNFDICMFDNTNDSGLNATYLNDYVLSNFGNLKKFQAVNSLVLHKSNEQNVIAKMAISHNDCRTQTLNGGYDFMLHLESDVFPEKNIIEQLLAHQKNIVGGVYYTDEGKYRCLMVHQKLELAPNEVTSLPSRMPEEIQLLNGGLHQVAQIGLGCILISKKVLERLSFRYVRGRNFHPDTFFSEDCHLKNIPIHVDTSSICKHENQNWGLYGIDFK